LGFNFWLEERDNIVQYRSALAIEPSVQLQTTKRLNPYKVRLKLAGIKQTYNPQIQQGHSDTSYAPA
jgi:hypothetical protein